MDGIVRAIYLKNGGFQNYAKVLDEILTNRIKMIMTGSLRPKSIIPDDDAIIERSKKTIAFFKDKLTDTYNLLIENCKQLSYFDNFLMVKDF